MLPRIPPNVSTTYFLYMHCLDLKTKEERKAFEEVLVVFELGGMCAQDAQVSVAEARHMVDANLREARQMKGR